MKSMEGVRRITNRMELVQNLRNKLVKTRLSLIAVTMLLVLSAGVNVVMFNKLQDSKEVVAKQETKIVELENTIKVMDKEKEELAIKLDIANSFETLMDKVSNLEDLALEAAHNAVDQVEGFISNYPSKTDISYVDYILDNTTGETIRTFETNEEMYVVYIANNNNVKQLNKEISLQFNSGTHNYKEAINKVEDTVIIIHDMK